MRFLEILLIIGYGAALTFVFLYSLIQLNLAINYLLSRNKKKESIPPYSTTDQHLPFVTIQLPIYNEMYVAERLLDAVAAIKYPVEKLEIQVLDDSTDETKDIIAKKVADLKAEGVPVEQVLRPDRVGYKAGALQYGLDRCKGEFVAIFDADFVPDPDFLLATLPYFKDDKIAVVQTKWGHINRNYSLLTYLQAFGLDAHFTLEQTGRNFGGHFINFNGTAGIWRKETIYDAGGWQADTLTEDLDLSYRAQVKGWKFKYLEEFVSPAELPATVNALKSQQFRWTKGAAETARKNLKLVFSSNHSLKTKIHGAFHLLNSSVFICILFLSVLSIPILFIKHSSGEYLLLIQLAGIFILSLVFLAFFYLISLYQHQKNIFKTLLLFIPTFPLFLSFSMGLSLHNAIAVFEGYIGKKTPFVRTPKFNINKADDKWKNNKYINTRISPLAFVEGALTGYFAWGVWAAFHLNDYGLLPFHIMLTFGFGALFVYTLFQSIKR